ncbi:hypothetical protein [Desulfolutivibrio sulfoxidireducens]|uniref:hypothetical protein n=1 Tax=Desulfolutivibrio sulfoxidireducens TaxID=2773299 RepID=UPI00068CD67B|nr:hypothetical protein [Desulfolutivibrio sulfoxidireducens]QLA18225.1 hypothetical protein GD605_18870 [Desulfolutivibrio sulfoxidireducens]
MSHIRRTVLTGLFFLAALCALCPGGRPAWASGDDIRPIRTGVSVSGVVQDDYTEGLLLAADDGTVYLVITPEEVTLEEEEAFHSKNRGTRVTFMGDVYQDEEGSLSLFVKSLP